MDNHIKRKTRNDNTIIEKHTAINLLASTLTIMDLINFPKEVFDYRYIHDRSSEYMVNGFISRYSGNEYQIKMFEIIPDTEESKKKYGRLIELVCICNEQIVHDLLFNMNGNLIAVNKNPADHHFTQQTITSKSGYVKVNDYTIVKGDPLC